MRVGGWGRAGRGGVTRRAGEGGGQERAAGEGGGRTGGVRAVWCSGVLGRVPDCFVTNLGNPAESESRTPRPMGDVGRDIRFLMARHAVKLALNPSNSSFMGDEFGLPQQPLGPFDTSRMHFYSLQHLVGCVMRLFFLPAPYKMELYTEIVAVLDWSAALPAYENPKLLVDLVSSKESIALASLDNSEFPPYMTFAHLCFTLAEPFAATYEPLTMMNVQLESLKAELKGIQNPTPANVAMYVLDTLDRVGPDVPTVAEKVENILERVCLAHQDLDDLEAVRYEVDRLTRRWTAHAVSIMVLVPVILHFDVGHTLQEDALAYLDSMNKILTTIHLNVNYHDEQFYNFVPTREWPYGGWAWYLPPSYRLPDLTYESCLGTLRTAVWKSSNQAVFHAWMECTMWHPFTSFDAWVDHHMA